MIRIGMAVLTGLSAALFLVMPAEAAGCAGILPAPRPIAPARTGHVRPCPEATGAVRRVAERSGVRDILKGDPERKALLDAVRAANADLNDRIPIVFIVELLRSDGRTAYFRGAVRRRSDGQPIDPATWGECEQDPDTAVLEALLEKRNGHWRASKANRCADDVFLTDEERARYAPFVTAD